MILKKSDAEHSKEVGLNKKKGKDQVEKKYDVRNIFVISDGQDILS